MSRHDWKPPGDWSNIAPDVNCPHCGMVIICPHTPPVPYPPNCITPRPTPPDIEWTDDFIENCRRLKAYERTDDFIENRRRSKAQRTSGSAADLPHLGAPTDSAQPGTNPRYVAGAIRGELDGLAAAVEGSRNDKLNRAAFAVFGFVKGGHADETTARAELERIALSIGLERSEIQATLRSAWGSATPREVPA